jgi:putative ATP-dependent endonuclease of the OLD family
MIRVETLDALRDAREQLMAGGGQRLLYRVLRKGADAKYADLKQRLLQLEECVQSDPNLSALKDAVHGILTRVSLQTAPGDNKVDFQFTSPEASELLKKIGMIYGADPISVARNGLGRNNLLYLSLILSQLAVTDSPSSEPYTCFRLVGVEEPEAHLHPHLQDHLAANIKDLQKEHDKSIQLLLTSHSTHVAAKLDLKNTAVIFQDSPGATPRHHYILDGFDEPEGTDSIRYLTLYLDATKSRMFFARRLILVEGISEQAVLPRLFEIHCPNKSLESIGATIVNVNGLAFSHFLKIVRNGYFRRCVVLTDKDAGERAQNLENEYKSSDLINIQISDESTFEKDLVSRNRQGKGKEILLKALELTKPVKGKAFRQASADADLNVEGFFSEIKDEKAEFAFNLARLLSTASCGFIIPPYIASAFEFLRQA